MRAVRYLGPEQNFELRTVPLPVVKSGHVLIEVKAASLCHTELHFANGTLSGVHDTTMGHECSGIIVSVGEDVLQSRIGERVIVYYYSGCGCCQHCNNGDEQLCSSLKAQYGFQSDGGLAQFITVYSRNAILLPEKISFQEAAPIGCGVTTAVHALELAELKIDEWVAIFGVNGVGFNIIQLAKHFGAKVSLLHQIYLYRASV
jgi:propanol-preferring alcohol dehydrogenase